MGKSHLSLRNKGTGIWELLLSDYDLIPPPKMAEPSPLETTIFREPLSHTLQVNRVLKCASQPHEVESREKSTWRVEINTKYCILMEIILE